MSFEQEIANGERFGFGRNWRDYLARIDAAAIEAARAHIRDWLQTDRLSGLTVLDIGSGSGLFSLAARDLGARVISLDYDPDSVRCAELLRQEHFGEEDPDWEIRRGSILDAGEVESLPEADVVYSWGVLHHTGAMHEAFANVASRVRPGGRLMIAIYNDQGWISRYWLGVKRLYNRHPWLRPLLIALHAPYLYLARRLLRWITRRPLERGMSLWHDMLDWLGGYPFEVASPAEVEAFFSARGFRLLRTHTVGRRQGCNEYLFVREVCNDQPANV